LLSKREEGKKKYPALLRDRKVHLYPFIRKKEEGGTHPTPFDLGGREENKKSSLLPFVHIGKEGKEKIGPNCRYQQIRGKKKEALPQKRYLRWRKFEDFLLGGKEKISDSCSAPIKGKVSYAPLSASLNAHGWGGKKETKKGASIFLRPRRWPQR